MTDDSERINRLREALKIAEEHKNGFMAANIRKEIQRVLSSDKA
jgi:hypothetical protein